MIISKIQGGLGNQMFQYAYGRSLSYKYNLNFYLDLSFYKNQYSETIRSFLLDKFTNTYIYTDIKYTNSTRIIDNFIYKNLDISTDSSYYLDGYWQSEKYFKGNEDIIRKDFEPSKEILDTLTKTPFIHNNNTISLHIRRTDYIKSNGYHPVQSIEYYKNAIDVMGDYDYIFVFSDDIQWCKDNLKFNNMIFMESFTEIEDLYLMSFCKKNIIANSSFSWWAAWLNKNLDKKVVAPSKWFGDHVGINQSDIIPDSWIKI